MSFALIYIRTWLASREEDRGASLVEYALLVAFIAIICVAAIGVFGENVSQGIDSGVDGFP